MDDPDARDGDGRSRCLSVNVRREAGDGRKATITGKSYDQIWDAAHKIVDAHLQIHKQDKTRGVIVGERTISFGSYGAWVGTYITPPTPGAPAYTVKVVRRKKMTTNVGEQDWEYKMLRDIYRELGLPALDPIRDPNYARRNDSRGRFIASERARSPDTIEERKSGRKSRHRTSWEETGGCG